MSQKILDALSKLDRENDDHWTADGLPLMKIVEELVGEDVDRKLLNEIAPDFTRESTPTPPGNTGKTPNSQGGAQGNTDEDNEDSDLASRREEAEKELSETSEALNKARKEHSSAVSKMDAIIAEEADIASGVTSAKDIKAFQKSQQEQRAKDAAKRQALSDFLAKQ